MLFFNPYAIPLLFTSIIFISLGIYIFQRNSQSKLNKALFYWCVFAFVWQFTYGLCFSSTSERLGYVLSRVGGASVFFLPSSYHYFVANFIDSKKEIRISNGFFVFFSVISFFILFTDKLLVGVYKYYFGFHGKGSFLYFICVLLFTIPLIRTIYILIKFLKERNIEPKRRNQAKYIFISFFVAILASLDFLPKFGIEYYPKGWFFFLIWVVSIAYAVLAYNLLDINIVLKKGFVYSIAIAFITAIYSILVTATGNLFQGFIGYQSFTLNLYTVFIIALLFNPLRDVIQRVLDKRYFHGTLESLDQERSRLQQELFHKEKLAYVGQLASSVVHEIRNPLTAIKTYIDFLPQKYQEADFKEKFQRLIPKEIERIEKVVNQLLNLAKPRQVNLRPVNIVDLIDTTLSLLEEGFALKKITVKKSYQSTEAIVQGDGEQLRQVFLNLFQNALQAMGEGGTLTIQTKDQRRKTKDPNEKKSSVSSLESLVSTDCLMITITDTGCGISQEDLKELFVPFHTTKENGIGLGLSITQEIIRMHGGAITVESKFGEGTKFSIGFPGA